MASGKEAKAVARSALFQPALVPGLLQTPEYIRAVLKRHNLSEDALTRTINGTLERQAVENRRATDDGGNSTSAE
jgi:Domain of unknown function (DUF5753)